MPYKVIQRNVIIRLCTTPEETLKSSLLQQKGAQTAGNLAHPGSSSQKRSNNSQNFRIKQQPTFYVQKKRFSDRISWTKSNSNCSS